jgi:hypothetical protein
MTARRPALDRPYARAVAARVPTPLPRRPYTYPVVTRVCRACGRAFKATRRRVYCNRDCGDAVRLLLAGRHLTRAS